MDKLKLKRVQYVIKPGDEDIMNKTKLKHIQCVVNPGGGGGGTVNVVGMTGLSSASSSNYVTLTDDIADVGPWTKSTSGNYVSVVNPLDAYWPFSEIEEFTDANGNAFVRFPKMWMKWIKNGQEVDGVKFASEQIDSDYFISDAYLDPRNTSSATYLDSFALGKYEGSITSSKAYSKSGQTCAVNVSMADARSACRSYGTSSNAYNGYQMMDAPQWVIYQLLCVMYFGARNIQQVVYSGRTSASSVSATGTTDGVTGLSGWNTNTTCIKLLGVENPFGNINKWIDGMLRQGMRTTIHYYRFPTQYQNGYQGWGDIDITSSLYVSASSNYYVKSVWTGASVDKGASLLVTKTTGGSATTYFGDLWEDGSSISNKNVWAVGGFYAGGTNAGLFYLLAWGYGGDSLTGFRLAYRPVNE